MVVVSFVKGMWESPFSDPLIQNRVESMAEVREHTVAHIEAEEAIIVKKETHSLSRGGIRRASETIVQGTPIHPRIGALTRDTSLM